MVLFSYRRFGYTYAALLVAILSVVSVSPASAASGLSVPVNRSSLVVLPAPSKEVMVSNPDVADVHAHNPTTLTVLGKRAGTTNVRVFGENGKLLRTIEVSVGYDLPAIRRSLKKFFPEENIGVEMVNTSVALTGQVRNAGVAEKAVRIVRDFLGGSDEKDFGVQAGTGTSASTADGNVNPEIMNLLKVTTGQQVMLRVRVGEVNRDAIKRLGIDPMAGVTQGNFFFQGGIGSAIAGNLATGNASVDTDYTVASDSYHGQTAFGWSNGNDAVGTVVKALEQDGLFRLLAEPNLVAISGEEAEFLAGGEIPVAVPQSSGGGTPTISIEYKPYGVSVRFTPDVLSENRIRIKVQPEVSEVSTAQEIQISGSRVPSITTRRARTTVELAPGESFMIAGLIRDRSQAKIDQLPGLKELPVLGALFRSTDFQRNESELVIAVTPYLVDPMKSSDVKLPTDDFRPASHAEMFFYGALGALPAEGGAAGVEGPTGFMVD